MKTQESASRLLNNIQAMKGRDEGSTEQNKGKGNGDGRRCEGTQEKCFNV